MHSVEAAVDVSMMAMMLPVQNIHYCLLQILIYHSIGRLTVPEDTVNLLLQVRLPLSVIDFVTSYKIIINSSSCESVV
jgi:hypothetical protein